MPVVIARRSGSDLESTFAAAHEPNRGDPGIQEIRRLELAAGPADAAARSDEARAVAAALGEIPDEQREVVVLRVYGQLRFREIAELLSISINTAQSRHRYALDALRARLATKGAER